MKELNVLHSIQLSKRYIISTLDKFKVPLTEIRDSLRVYPKFTHIASILVVNYISHLVLSFVLSDYQNAPVKLIKIYKYLSTFMSLRT